uniref:G-protein coupled receptors family 1 profile domain-containing protein n=1 Tax=Globodera rostochiensis TaxID=31243 RepID=A0A914IER9_GLORO
MQFLFYIAVADMLALFISGVADRISGVGWRRLLYCAKIHYLMGSWSVCLWITESTAEMVLAFNRCVEVSSSYWADVLFHGKRTYLLYFLLFTTPGLFSGLFGSWFFNPHVDYIDDFGKTNTQTGGGFSRSQKITPSDSDQFAQLAWILSHDIPPIIYLLLNKTFMRNPVADHFNDIYYRITPLLY